MPIRIKLSRKMLTTFFIVVLFALVLPFETVRNQSYAANNSSCQLTWNSVPDPNSVGASAVAALSASDVWAASDSLLHWNGSTWTAVQPLSSRAITDFGIIAPNDIWAAGWFLENSYYRSLVLHWDGVAWSDVPTPDIGPLEGIAALTSNSIWIIGNVENSNPVPTSLHWDGASWQTIPMSFSVPIARYGWVRGISAIAEDDVWAVGEFYGRPSELSDVLVWHWDGTQWDHKPIGMGWLAQFTAVAAVSSNDVWAVGKRAPDEAIIAHWNGTQWSLVSSYPNGILNAVAGLSANDAWAVGWYETENSHQMLIEHWDGIRWNVVNLPKQTSPINSLSTITALTATDVWAGGSSILRGTVPCLTAKPTKPKLLFPHDLATLRRTNPRLRWEPASGASWYELIVRRGAKIVDQQYYLTDTRYITTALKRSSTYSWRVKACNSVGCSASRWWQFTILK